MNKFLLLIAIVTLFGIGNVYALSCAYMTVDDLYFSSENIFVAKVLSYTIIPENSEGHNYSYKLDIQKNYKGNKQDGTYTALGTPQDMEQNMWGFNTPLEVGKTYIIYGDILSTGGCSPNGIYNTSNSNNRYMDLDIYADRSNNSLFDRYMYVAERVYAYLRDNNNSQESRKKISYLRERAQNKRLGKYTSCGELSTTECEVRYSSCVVDKNLFGKVCRDIDTQESQVLQQVLQQVLNLCSSTGGERNNSVCTCPAKPYVTDMNDIHEYMKTGNTIVWDSKFGCRQESELCSLKSGSWTSLEYTDTLQSPTTAENCLQRAYDGYIQEINDGVLDGYKFLFRSRYSDVVYRNHDTNSCHRRVYKDGYPKCSVDISGRSSGK